MALKYSALRGATQAVTQDVSHTGGTFSLDFSSANHFNLDLSGAYFDTVGSIEYVGGGPELIGYGINVGLGEFIVTSSATAAAGDLIIVTISAADQDSNLNTNIVDSGYQQIDKRFSNGGDDITLAMYYKVVPNGQSIGSVTIGDLNNSGSSQVATMYVFRNADISGNFTTTGKVTSGSYRTSPSTITTVANDSLIFVAVGGVHDSSSGPVYTSSDTFIESSTASQSVNNGYDAIIFTGVADAPAAGNYSFSNLSGNANDKTGFFAAAISIEIAPRSVIKSVPAIIEAINMPTELSEFSIYASNTHSSGNAIALQWNSNINLGTSYIVNGSDLFAEFKAINETVPSVFSTRTWTV